MPVHNGERYVEAAIQSILKQTFSDFELIVIENGSTDNTKEILVRIGKTDDRIQLIYRQQKGLINARNEGLRRSKGRYIVNMDADDLMRPDCFRQQIEYMEQHPEISLLGVQIYECKCLPLLKKGIPGKMNCKYGLLFYTAILQSGTMLRKSVLDTHNLVYDDNYAVAEDYKLWTEIAAVSEVDLLPKPLLFVRPHPKRVSACSGKEMIDNHKRVMASQFKQVLGIGNFPFGKPGIFDPQWIKNIYDLAFTDDIRQSVGKDAWNAMHLGFQDLAAKGGLTVFWYYLRQAGAAKIFAGPMLGFRYILRSLKWHFTIEK